MAWFSHGDDDNASMVRALKNNGIISEAHPEVEFAMEAVDRAHFVNDKRVSIYLVSTRTFDHWVY